MVNCETIPLRAPKGWKVVRRDGQMAPIIISLPSVSEYYVTDSHFALLTYSQAEADNDCEVDT